jgi:hypothetical protein
MIATRFLIYCLVAWLLFEGAAFAGAADTAASGKVDGVVSVAGVAGRPKPLPVFKSRSFCGATVVNETLLIGADGRLRNAAVILRPLSGGMVAQPKKLVLDNQRCAFAPHVQVAPLGSELLLKNSDPILHTVHARLGRETLFNVGLPKWRVVTKRLDRAGVIRIDCDVLHTWMSAAIIVTDSPYFAVTDETGGFSFDAVPAGNYDIEIWHERLGVKTRRLSVTSNGAVSLDVVYALGENSR